MEEITINLYKFSELSQEAKDYAVARNAETDDYHWSSDALKSLKKFAEHFGAELKDYSIDYHNCSPSYVKFELPYEDYTSNELKKLIKDMGSFNKKTKRGLGDCKFTGVGSDEDAADGARIAYYAGERDLNELLQAGFRSWLKAAQSDYEYQLSEKGYAEYCDGNDVKFMSNGGIPPRHLLAKS